MLYYYLITYIIQAILHRLNKIDDPIAFQMLPKKTRWVVNIAAKYLPSSAIDKFDWIVQRTDFIDEQLCQFLMDTTTTTTANSSSSSGSPAPQASSTCRSRRQVLVLGSGYDTRCLRFGMRPYPHDLDFYCVDLPSVTSNCQQIVERYLRDNEYEYYDADDKSMIKIKKQPTYVPFDLNDVAISKEKNTKSLLLDTLAASEYGFITDGSIPTMVICEAVLFYLNPDAAQTITSELFRLSAPPSSSDNDSADNNDDDRKIKAYNKFATRY